MAKREQLRQVRAGQIINASSKKMESVLLLALNSVIEKLISTHNISIEWEQSIKLSSIVADLKEYYPEVNFHYHFDTSSLKPDGGITYLVDKANNRYPILIAEAKRQGTNDQREAEGLPKQAKGNAIERLGKNLIGFRTWFSQESIFPFVVFGEGVDFAPDSSILDRVTTMAMFAPLNSLEVRNPNWHGQSPRGSFYFREQTWATSEIEPILLSIAENSIEYYIEKHGAKSFQL